MKWAIVVLAVLFSAPLASAENRLQSLSSYEVNNTLEAIQEQRQLARQARRNPGLRRRDILRIDDFLRALEIEEGLLRDLQPGERPVATIAHGVPSAMFPSVGALLENGEAVCSGTLIGHRSFLTAKHCFETPDVDIYSVYFQHAGIFELDEILSPPGGDVDVAIVRLQGSVAGVARAAAPDIVTADGKILQIVGYGITGNNQINSGIKRRGGITTTVCPQNPDQFVCWDFHPPYDPLGTNSNGCNRDSGGPVGMVSEEFLQIVDSVNLKVPTEFQCHLASLSWSLAVHPLLDWVDETLASEGPAPSANFPVCCTGGVLVLVEDGSFPIQNSFEPNVIAYTISVPSAARTLRVGLNGTDTPLSDLKLEVKPAVDFPHSSVCRDEGRYVFCEYQFTDTPPATWKIIVRNKPGTSISYQLVVTQFSL